MADNPPAFPRSHAHSGHNGMNLRDYIATAALPVIIEDLARPINEALAPRDMPAAAAKAAYMYADAMLAERAK